MIKNKKDALDFVQKYSEFELFDFFDGSIWFRYDGNNDYRNYTINHDESGIIGTTITDVADYIWRNRKKINEWLKDNNTRQVKEILR